MALMSARDFSNSPAQVAAERAAGIYRAPVPTTPAPSMPQAYTPPASSSSSSNGGGNPWNSYSPLGMPSVPSATTAAPAPSSGGYTPTPFGSPLVPGYMQGGTKTTQQTATPMSNSGSSSVIGNVNGSPDLNKSYQHIYDSVRASNPGRNQINTWADRSGSVYDTTKMTPQQIFAMSLIKDGNPNASKILQGMGLDMNGNPTSPEPTYSATAAPARTAVPTSSDPFTTPTPGYMQGGTNTASATATPMSQSGTAGTGYAKNPTVDAMPIDQQLAYYAKNPQEAQQEIGRAQGVGGQAATDWANQLSSALGSSGQTGQTAAPMQSSGQGTSNQQTATPNDLYKDPYARTPESIAALAKSRIDAILQGGRTAAAGSLTNAKNANDYTNQIKGDNRVLEDFTFKNRNDPFSGNTSYLEAQNLRNRSIQDTAQNKDYSAQVSQIQQKLADLETAAPGQQQQIINDLQQIERTTGINVAQLQEQQKNNQFNQQHQKFTEQQAVKQQHIDLANTLSKQYGVPVYPTDDPMLSYAQVAGIPTVDAQKIAQDAKQSTLDNAIKLALANNTITQTQASILNQARNAANSETSTANSNQNAKDRLAFDKEQAANKPAPKNDLESQYISGFESLTPEKRKEALKNEKAAIVKDIGTSGYNSLYNMYVDQFGNPK